MIYRQFKISRFRGVTEVTVSLVRGDLVLLVGLNESGKTTILRAIEAFDFRNDPAPPHLARFLSSVRNKSDLLTNEPAIITAEMELDSPLKLADVARGILGSLRRDIERRRILDDLVSTLNKARHLRISRVFPFRNGTPREPHYRIEADHAFLDDDAAAAVAQRLVELSPFILYFEDFTDQIPERIFTAHSNDAFNPDWYDIIDGLFFHTSSQYSIDTFKKLHSKGKPRPDDAGTVMRRVNNTLDDVFTRKWENLSGVRDISATQLISNFGARSPHFEIKVTDTDGTTYSVDERSKGALWYLSFLMKTEFRRKKMRQDSGKPIFLIDEPASNLHSTAQTNMLGDFRQLVEDTSVIYTTHSQYLVSLENIRNTYVISREDGVVHATKWGEYLRQDAPQVSHYQPLANVLQLIPNSLSVPWDTAVITEGPSDRHALLVMHRVLFGEDPSWVIYPGTNAFNLRPLISLNLGWGSEFRVLLDSDDAGKEAQERYMEEFGLDKSIIMLLPEDSKKIEGYFTESERKALYELAFEEVKTGDVTKNEFKSALSVLTAGGIPSGEMAKWLGKETRTRFESLFQALGLGEWNAERRGE